MWRRVDAQAKACGHGVTSGHPLSVASEHPFGRSGFDDPALEADHAFLCKGGVFTDDVIATWIDYKRTYEIAPFNLRVTPYEFALYYDV